jgi:hypothetical protein
MDFDTSIFDEIQDMSGEIFDIEDFNEMKQDLMSLIESCIDLEASLTDDGRQSVAEFRQCAS